MVIHSKAIPEGGDSEIGYQDLSGFDEIDQKAEKAEPKSTVVWKRLKPSQAACAPARRSFHNLVVAPSSGRGPKEQTILLVGGETEPKYRGRQIQPLVLCAPSASADSAVAAPAIGRRESIRDSMLRASIGGPGSEAFGGFSREVSQHDVSPWSPRASIARSTRSPGPLGLDGDRAASPAPVAAAPVPDLDRWEWRPNKTELTQRLRGCSVTAVGHLILVFGGLRLDTLTPTKVPVGEALYQSSQVSGELHVFDTQQGKWRHLKGEGAGKTQVEYEQVQAAAPANPTRRASNVNAAQAATAAGKRPSIINMAPIAAPILEPSEDIQADGEPPRSRFEHAACTVETKGNWLIVHGGRSAKHAYPIESSFVLQVRGRQFKWARLHPGRVTHGQGEKLQDHGQMLQSQARRKQFTRRGHTLCAVPHRPRHLVMFGGRMDSGEEGRICSELMIIEVDAENATYMIMPHQSIGQPPAARIYHSACTLGHFLVVFGGISRKGEALNDLHLLHMGPMIWSRMRSPFDAEALNIVWPTPRWGHSAVTVERPEGRGGVAMLIFGGMAPGNQQLDECLCLCFETPMSSSGDGGGPGTEVFGIYPEGILVSMWDRLFANLASLEHEQMLKVSKQSEESEVMSSRLQDFENQLASMEAQAGMAERTVAAIDKTIQAANLRLDQAKAQTAEEQAEAAAQIAASELQVEGLRRKLERLEITQDILEKGRLISPADLVLHPADMGAVVPFGKRTDVTTPIPTPAAKGAAVPALVPASEAVLTRSGFWCGTPVTLEEIALPTVAESTDDQVRKAPGTQRPATQRGAWEAAARRELRLAVKLRHPNLVEYYGGSLDGDRLLLVAEPPLVPLMLELRVRHHPRLAPGKGKGRLAVSLDVALALEYLHCRGIAHRRVGIERVFLRDAPRLVAKLGGLLPARILWRAQKEWLMVSQARRLPAQRHRAGLKTRNSIGPGDANTVHDAAAPALLAGQLPNPADPRAVDMFALGVLILQLFGNEEGEEGQRTLNRTGSRLKGSGRLDEWPQSPHHPDKPVASAAVGRIRDRTVRLVVMRCMEKDPRHRMSASAAARALENALSGDGLVADAPEVDLSNRFPLVDADLEALVGAEELE